MPLHIGSDEIDALYLGAEPIVAVYHGDELIYGGELPTVAVDRHGLPLDDTSVLYGGSFPPVAGLTRDQVRSTVPTKYGTAPRMEYAYWFMRAAGLRNTGENLMFCSVPAVETDYSVKAAADGRHLMVAAEPRESNTGGAVNVRWPELVADLNTPATEAYVRTRAMLAQFKAHFAHPDVPLESVIHVSLSHEADSFTIPPAPVPGVHSVIAGSGMAGTWDFRLATFYGAAPFGPMQESLGALVASGVTLSASEGVRIPFTRGEGVTTYPTHYVYGRKDAGTWQRLAIVPAGATTVDVTSLGSAVNRTPKLALTDYSGRAMGTPQEFAAAVKALIDLTRSEGLGNRVFWHITLTGQPFEFRARFSADYWIPAGPDGVRGASAGLSAVAVDAYSGLRFSAGDEPWASVLFEQPAGHPYGQYDKKFGAWRNEAGAGNDWRRELPVIIPEFGTHPAWVDDTILALRAPGYHVDSSAVFGAQDSRIPDANLNEVRESFYDNVREAIESGLYPEIVYMGKYDGNSHNGWRHGRLIDVPGVPGVDLGPDHPEALLTAAAVRRLWTAPEARWRATPGLDAHRHAVAKASAAGGVALGTGLAVGPLVFPAGIPVGRLVSIVYGTNLGIRGNTQAAALNVERQPNPPNGHVYRAVVGGTTAASQPAGFATATSVGNQVVDGTVTWENIGPVLAVTEDPASAVGNVARYDHGFALAGISGSVHFLSVPIEEEARPVTSVGGYALNVQARGVGLHVRVAAVVAQGVDLSGTVAKSAGAGSASSLTPSTGAITLPGRAVVVGGIFYVATGTPLFVPQAGAFEADDAMAGTNNLRGLATTVRPRQVSGSITPTGSWSDVTARGWVGAAVGYPELM